MIAALLTMPTTRESVPEAPRETLTMPPSLRFRAPGVSCRVTALVLALGISTHEVSARAQQVSPSAPSAPTAPSAPPPDHAPQSYQPLRTPPVNQPLYSKAVGLGMIGGLYGVVYTWTYF